MNMQSISGAVKFLKQSLPCLCAPHLLKAWLFPSLPMLHLFLRDFYFFKYLLVCHYYVNFPLSILQSKFIQRMLCLFSSYSTSSLFSDSSNKEVFFFFLLFLFCLAFERGGSHIVQGGPELNCGRGWRWGSGLLVSSPGCRHYRFMMQYPALSIL